MFDSQNLLLEAGDDFLRRYGKPFDIKIIYLTYGSVVFLDLNLWNISVRTVSKLKIPNSKFPKYENLWMQTLRINLTNLKAVS